MNNRICVIVAMDDEIKKFLDYKSEEISVIEEKPFKIMSYHNHLILITGIGLINASAGLSYIAAKYKPSSFLNVGLAGAVNKDLNILDICSIRSAFHAGVDATVFGYEYGQTPKERLKFDSDTNLLKIISQLGINKTANLASSDSFISKLDQYNEYIKPINDNIQLFDMEAYAFYQIAYKFEIPIVSIKVVSDVLTTKEDNNLQFIEILDQGSQMISEVMVKYLK